ncbi:MAG: response regulator [Burkholderiaceae bacterium]
MIAHGIEAPPARVARGKPPAGRVLVSFASATGWLSVSVQDDGAGLDMAAIAERARALHLLATDLDLDASAAEQLILAHRVLDARARESDQRSRRGSGCGQSDRTFDARRVTGSIAAGQGVSVQIDLPLEMMLRPLFVVRARHHVLALSTRGVRSIEADVENIQWQEGSGRYRRGERIIEVRTLESVLGLPERVLLGAQDRAPMLMRVEVPGGRECAILVPEPGPARPALVREMAPYMPRLPGIDGAAVLGDGSIAAVLDLPELFSTAAAAPAVVPLAEAPAAPVHLSGGRRLGQRTSCHQPVSRRSWLCNRSRRQRGRQALEQLRSRRPDLLIVDLEMPEMDGLELTRAVRELPGAQSLPIIMITSRASARCAAVRSRPVPITSWPNLQRG